MKTFPRFVFGSLMVVILIGCGTTTQTSDPTVVIPSFSSTNITITQTVTRLPTATRRATATLRPSATPSITPTTDLTQVAIYDASLTAHIVELTLVPQFPRVCETQYAPPVFSPNHQWLVESCYTHDLTLIFSKRETQTIWKLYFKDYLPQMEYIPDGWLGIVHWAKDERYVYFMSSLGGDGGECFYNHPDRGAGLFRLDLQSGSVTTVLPPSSDFWWYGFSFSPTDRRLVYGPQARDLKILDLTTGEIIDIASGSDNYETGGYLWSVDGLKLVYSVLTRNEQGERDKYSLRFVDARLGIEQILFEAPDKCFSALSWNANNMLMVEREGNEGKVLIEYDLNSVNIENSTTSTPNP